MLCKTYQNQCQRRTSPRTKKKRKDPARQEPGRASRILPPAGHDPGAPGAAAHHLYVTQSRAAQAAVVTARAVNVASGKKTTASVRSKDRRVGIAPATVVERGLAEAGLHGRARVSTDHVRTMATATEAATITVGRKPPRGADQQKGLIHLAKTAATMARDLSLGKLNGGASAEEQTRLKGIPTLQPAKSVTSAEENTLTKIWWHKEQGHR